MVRYKQNTPAIIKYPFWRMTAKNPDAAYACINQGQAACPEEIEAQSICINGDIGEVLTRLSGAVDAVLPVYNKRTEI